MADNVWTLKTNKFNSISAKKKTSKCKWTYSRSLIFLLWPSMRILRESSKGFVWPASLSFWCISFLSFFPSEISREYVTNSIRYGSYFLICAIAETITVSLDEWHYKKKNSYLFREEEDAHTQGHDKHTHTHRGRKEKKTKESHERGDGNQVRSARLRTSKWRRVLKKPGPCPPATGFDRRKWRWGKEREREQEEGSTTGTREEVFPIGQKQVRFLFFQIIFFRSLSKRFSFFSSLTFRLAERRSTDELCGNGFKKKRSKTIPTK